MELETLDELPESLRKLISSIEAGALPQRPVLTSFLSDDHLITYDYDLDGATSLIANFEVAQTSHGWCIYDCILYEDAIQIARYAFVPGAIPIVNADHWALPAPAVSSPSIFL